MAGEALCGKESCADGAEMRAWQKTLDIPLTPLKLQL